MISEQQTKYVFMPLLGFVVAYWLTPAVGRFARSIGMVDVPGARRIHRHVTPRGGGIAVFLAFHAVCAATFLLPWHAFDATLNLNWWLSFLPLSSFLLLAGLADDLKGLRPRVKLGCQILVALASYTQGISFTCLLNVALPWYVDSVLTVAWFLAFINAFNLIDGMDGLASGLAVIAALGFAGVSALQHLPGDALIVLGLAGAAMGFLRYNFHPASIFLGDSGSMFLGFTFAAISLSTVSKETAMISVAVPLLAAGVPIFDMCLAIWRRTIRGLMGKPEAHGASNVKELMFAADKDHLHHRLMRSGLSQQTAAFWLYVLALVLVSVGLLSLFYRSHRMGIYLVAFVLGSYVAVRHLAQVELWDSAEYIARGLRRPPRKVLAVILFPPLDILLLAAVLALSLVLLRGQSRFEDIRQLWLEELPMWVGIPFIAVALSGSYRRVWSQARVSDFVFLGTALAAGLLTGAGLTGIVGTWGKRALLLQLLLYGGLSIPLLTGVRAFPRAMADLLTWSRRARLGPHTACGNTLICGAGDHSALLVRELGHQAIDNPDGRRVVGFLVDDRNLLGRYVHGHKVLGDHGDLPRIAALHDVRQIVIGDPMEPAARWRLIETARRHGLEVFEWCTEIRPVPPQVSGT